MVNQVCQWGVIGQKVLQKHEEREAKIHKRKCYRKFEYGELPTYKKLLNSGRMRLESFERAMRFYFEHSKMKLGYMQKKLVDVFIMAALRKFFQHDLVSNLQFLSRKYAIDELNDAVAILFPVCAFECIYNLLYDRDVPERLKDLPGLLPSVQYRSLGMK